MKTTVQALSHPSYDNAGPSVMIQTRSGTKYIVGRFSEGLQRTLAQNRIRTSKLGHIFLTGPMNWDAVGGLPGFLLTVGDQGLSNISVQSTSTEVSIARDSWRHFIFHQNLDVDLREPGTIFSDEFVAIEGVSLVSGKLPLTSKQSSSYIVQILPSRGKFLVNRAVELGVPKGTMFRDLTKGISVVTPQGKTVHPRDVMEEPKTPPRLLVIDCPSRDYISSAIAFPWDKRILRKRKHDEAVSDDTYDVDIKLVYHFLGEDVDPFTGDYYDFILKLDRFNCLQFISHPLYCPNGIALEGLAMLHLKLRQVFPQSFRKLYSANSKKSIPSEVRNETKSLGLSLSGEPVDAIQPLHALDVIVLEPELRQESSIAKLDGAVEWSEDASKALSQDVDVDGPYLVEPEIITLGTGSSQPSKYRNVACTLLRTKYTSIMFDCGEGTLGSLLRMYGPDLAMKRIKELGVLYISHLHADHHLGMLSVLKEWVKVSESGAVLHLLGPSPLKKFLEEWFALEDDVGRAFSSGRVEFHDNENFIVGRGYRHHEGSSESQTDEISIGSTTVRVQTCRAIHCDLAYCVSITLEDGFKVSYSGDTRPNTFFAQAVGLNSDLLIHEATHEDDLAEEAKMKRHSTIGEALSVSRAMNAKATMLTHFSQRYPKLPNVKGLTLQNTALGFDGQRLYFSEIPDQLRKRAELEAIFADSEDYASPESV